MKPSQHAALSVVSGGFVGAALGSWPAALSCALIGFFIGQQFDGTTVPLSAGFAICGLLALGCVLFADRGRLFSTGPARA